MRRLVVAALLLGCTCTLTEDVKLSVVGLTPGVERSQRAIKGATVGVAYAGGRVEWLTTNDTGAVHFPKASSAGGPSRILVCADGWAASVVENVNAGGYTLVLAPRDNQVSTVRAAGWTDSIPPMCGTTDANRAVAP